MQNPELEYVERAEKTPLSCRIVSIENSSPHWHYEYEIFFVLRGSISVHTEEGDWRLKDGNIILFNACEIHSINQPEPGNLCLVLQFNPEIFNEIYEKSSFRFDLNTCKETGIPDAVCQILRSDLAKIGLLMHEQPNGYQFFIKSHLYDLAGAMFKHLRYEVGSKSKNPMDFKLKDFDNIKNYIKQHFATEINLEQMCLDLAMSRAKLYRILKEAGTESYKSLVNFYRVEHAKGLLRSGTSSIQHIAAVSGFESDSTFYRVFGELTSVTPSQYRESPRNTQTSLGVQGYVGFSMPKALSVLREYCA